MSSNTKIIKEYEEYLEKGEYEKAKELFRKSNKKTLTNGLLNASFEMGISESFLISLYDETNYEMMLINACKYDNIKIVEELKKIREPKQEELDKAFGKTFIDGNQMMSEYLINLGADIHSSNEYAFRWGMYYGMLEMCKWLYGKFRDIDIHAYNGFVIKNATLQNNIEIVKWCFDTDYQNSLEYLDHLIKLSIKLNHYEIFKFLFVRLRTKLDNINNNTYIYYFEIGLYYDSGEICRYIVSNTRYNYFNYFGLAVIYNDVKICKFINHVSNGSFNIHFNNDTIYKMAIHNGAVATFDYLLTIDPEYDKSNNQELFMTNIMGGNLEMCKRIVDTVDIHYQNETPFRMAEMYGHNEICQWLNDLDDILIEMYDPNKNMRYFIKPIVN